MPRRDGVVDDAVAVAEVEAVAAEGSVASHFISFSAVTWLNSRLRMFMYVESPIRPAATAAAEVATPVWAAAAPSVEAAADAVKGVRRARAPCRRRACAVRWSGSRGESLRWVLLDQVETVGTGSVIANIQDPERPSRGFLGVLPGSTSDGAIHRQRGAISRRLRLGSAERLPAWTFVQKKIAKRSDRRRVKVSKKSPRRIRRKSR